MNAGDAADQVMRQVDKMLKLNERTARDARLLKVICQYAEWLIILWWHFLVSFGSVSLIFFMDL